MDQQRKSPFPGSPRDPQKAQQDFREAQETLAWLEPLSKDERFQRYLAVLSGMANREQAIALNVSVPVETCNNHRQRLHALREALRWPEETLNVALATVRDHQQKTTPASGL